MNIIQDTILYFNQGGSDKVYQAQINKVEDGHTVTFAYGRRGSTLKMGTKTATPVELSKANKIYEKLIKSKTSKGYCESNEGKVHIQINNDQKHSGICCQLLNPIDKLEALRLCSDNNYCAQEKYDGERRLIQKTGTSIQGINRKGLYINQSSVILDNVKKIEATSFVLDGEDLGDKYAVFDILEYNGEDLRNKKYFERYQILSELIEDNDCLWATPTAFLAEDKSVLLDLMNKEGREGVVFKRISSPYSVGRPNSGGDQFKMKFYETCSVIVDHQNDSKRSVSISGIDKNNRIPLGNVTIPINKDIPQPEDIIEVRYLYAYEGGSLYQPLYLCKRTDLNHNDCVLSQLKYKPECVD